MTKPFMAGAYRAATPDTRQPTAKAARPAAFRRSLSHLWRLASATA